MFVLMQSRPRGTGTEVAPICIHTLIITTTVIHGALVIICKESVTGRICLYILNTNFGTLYSIQNIIKIMVAAAIFNQALVIIYKNSITGRMGIIIFLDVIVDVYHES